MNNQLAHILSQGDEAACLAFFQGMPEPERREHLPQIKATLKEAKKTPWLRECNTSRPNPAIELVKLLFAELGAGEGGDAASTLQQAFDANSRKLLIQPLR